MTISLLWPGPPALSQFRLDKLRAELNDFCGAQRVQGVYAQTVHALAVSRALSDAERDVARAQQFDAFGRAGDRGHTRGRRRQHDDGRCVDLFRPRRRRSR